MGRLARWQRGLLAAWLALAALLAAGPAAAQGALVLDPLLPPVLLADRGEAWVDATGRLPIAAVAQRPAPDWHATAPARIYRLDRGEALWIRFTVPPTPAAERWYLEVPHAALDQVSLFAPAAGAWAVRTAGDTVAHSSWPLPHRHPVLPLASSPQEPRVHYLQIRNGTNFGAPLQFVNDSYLMRHEQGTALVLGVHFGLVLLAVVLSLAGGATFREPIYSCYALAMLLMALTQAAITGVAGLYLWGDWPWWNNLAPQVLPLPALAALQLFMAEQLSLRERSRHVHRALMAAALLSLPLAAALLLMPVATQRLLLLTIYVLGGMAATFAVVLWCALRGDRYAPWLLAAAVPVGICALFPLARAAGLMPIGFWTTHGMQVAVTLELPLLLLAMVWRTQHRREHARRMQGLGRTDPDTGLSNAAVFHERLVRLIAQSRRLRMRSAMLLVDISSIERVRRRFGAESARELTLHVAGRLLSVGREIDTVARLSEHRFGLLLEGPLRADEVAEAGPRIIARCLMPARGRPIEWAVQVRVAQALLPSDGSDADQLIERLEMLLDSVPHDSRRAVFMLSEAAELTTEY